jgi:hypothetical protein
MRMIDAEITIVMTAALPVTTGPDLRTRYWGVAETPGFR